MALPTPTITVQDGASGTANALAANAIAYVTAGNTITIALQSTAGVIFADWQILPYLPSPGIPYSIVQPARWYPGGNVPASFSFVAPPAPASFQIVTEVSDGNNSTICINTLVVALKVAGAYHSARAVSTANVANLASATVTVDGVTLVQGDYVLLAGQTTTSQNGLYVVGAVAGGLAPLTRPADFATGTVFDKSHPQIVELGPEGTAWANSTWKITTTGPITVDTSNHNWLPRIQRGSGATGAGTTVAITTLWAFASTSTIVANDNTAAAAVQVGAIVAGFGNGTCTLTGTTGHTIGWVLVNW